MTVYHLPRTNLRFKAQESMKKHLKDALSTAPVNTVITKESPYFNLILDMFERHPCLGGVLKPDAFKLVKDNTTYRTEAFRPHYLGKDGLFHSFSLMKKCVTGRSDTLWSDQCDAFRYEIQSQIDEFRKNNKGCSECHNNTKPCDIDHVIPFKDILSNFLTQNEDEEIPTEFINEGVHKRFVDKAYREKWFDYHKHNALLTSLCIDCHKKKTFGIN